MANNNIIFVGGIHGVGKTTLCNKLSSRLNIHCYSASSLIRKIKDSPRKALTKKVLNIDTNQDLLITAINQHVDKNKICILDGHFALLNREGLVSEIALPTFLSISPIAIIVVIDSIPNILIKLKCRDSITYSKKKLELFQKKELTLSKKVSDYIDIPYFVHDINEDIDDVHKFIENIKNCHNKI